MTTLSSKSENISTRATVLTVIGSALMLAFTINPVLAKSTEADMSAVPSKVDTVLVETEKAISSLRVNQDMSLSSINKAIESIKLLETAYDKKVATKTKEKDNTHIAKGYTHYYPPISQNVFDNISAYPTLSKKIDTDVVYKGSHEGDQSGAYFDYTFAKASLMTARDAINDNDTLEAIANLRRVFEAVYLAPDFNVKKSS